jgi:hypothetical protein
VAEPRLSVVVAAAKLPGAVPQLLEVLAADIASGVVEVIVATAATPSPDVAGRARIVAASRGTTIPRLRAMGLAAARGDIAALTEGFCIPAAGWADALIAAHAANAAVAIGGPIDRRQGGAADWALTLQEYGRFLRRAPEGPVHGLPGPNVSYKIERLRRVLGELPDEIAEVDVHGILIQRGEELRSAPGALMYDANDQRFGRSIGSMFQHGRLFGAWRVRAQPAPVRALRAAMAPLAPAAQLVRIARGAVPAGRGRQLFRSLPCLLTLLVAWAIGEATGSLFGEGASREHWS